MPTTSNRETLAARLKAVTAHALDPDRLHRNIERFVGAVQVPVGLAGPMKVLGDHADGLFHVPFATTEGTLVSGYTMGMLAASRSGGIRVKIISRHTDITPVFELKNLDESFRFAEWLPRRFDELSRVCATETTHSRLTGLKTLIVGR